MLMCVCAEWLSWTLLQTLQSDSNLIVTKHGFWFPFTDVINCAKFRRYCTNSFWMARPRKLGIPIDLRWPLQQLELYRAVLWSGVLWTICHFMLACGCNVSFVLTLQSVVASDGKFQWFYVLCLQNVWVGHCCRLCNWYVVFSLP